jgi:feruloyl esterase
MNRLSRVMTALSVSVGIAAAIEAAATHSASCTGLAGTALPDTRIESATVVPPGPFHPPGSRDGTADPDLPGFCRVTGVTNPAIRFEVWLPLSHWNGKFEGVGNGGTAGAISYTPMATALGRGYATAGTDTGHVNASIFDASWAMGRPDLLEDFGHRSVHLVTRNAKALVRAFYGARERHAYFWGCSKGGQQGLMEAQRYPDDYEGIVAGDPANAWTAIYAGDHLWSAQATLKTPASYIPASKVPLLADAVNAACDALDGVEDGVLNDPRQCGFDPVTLACRPDDDEDTCLTAGQVEAVRAIWRGARDSSGHQIFPGLVPGGEAGPRGWAAWTTGRAPMTSLHFLSANEFFRYAVFANPEWDFRTFDYDRDMALTARTVGTALDATDPDLRAFRRHGGKLIAYHGFSDPDISPLNSINYYEAVVTHLQGSRTREQALRDTQSFFRLFMVPGMQHCTGGPGTTSFDMIDALEQWVEHGVAPARLEAAHLSNGTVDRRRPLCPYPQSAGYKGRGDTNDAANFVCAAR